MARNLDLACLVFIACVLGVSAEIVRPCQPVTDACVGKYLSENSGCSLKLGNKAELDPYKADHFYFETPYFNITEDRHNITVTGHSKSSVKDFFYNTVSRRAVLTLSVPDIQFQGTTILHYRQPGAEPIDITTGYLVHFTNMTLTTIFNDYKKPTLANSASYPTIPKWPTFDNGKGLAEAAKKDPRVAFLVSEYERVPMVATLEAFQYRAPALVHLYAQYRLCVY